MNNTNSVSELCDMILLARELVEEVYSLNKKRLVREKAESEVNNVRNKNEER